MVKMPVTRLVCLLAAATAVAQNAAPPYAPGTLTLGGVTVTGSLRARGYGWDWFTPTTGDDVYGYSGNLLRIGFSKKHETWEWNAEFAIPFILGLPQNATAPAPQGALGFGSSYFTANDGNRNTAMIFPKQLYVRLTPTKANSVRFGRVEFNDGVEGTSKNATVMALKNTRLQSRLIGTFVFTDVGRSFDGTLYQYTKPKATFTFLGAIPTRGVFQTDGWGWNRAAVGYTSVVRPWGKKRHSAETRFLALYYDDFRNGIVKTDNRPAAAKARELANIRLWTAGGSTVHVFDTTKGSFDFVGWGVAQTGNWGVQSHAAFALDAEAGYQQKIAPRLKPWFRGGYSMSTGDGNPNDNQHGTFFQVLPTPRPYARFPFFNMMNNIDRFGSLTLRPHAKVTTVSDFHSLSLENANDLWYSGGGVFQPWTFGYNGRATGGRKSLANLYDTSVEYRHNARFTFTGYLGYAQGLAAMKQIYPAGKNGLFGYVEVLARF